METVFHYVTSPSQCGYLPNQCWEMEYEIVSSLSPAEYMARLEAGWRRFGVSLFRPRCSACSACRSLRIVVDRFRPDRSQRRNRKVNEGHVRLEIGTPRVTEANLDLYDRFHAHQSEIKGWPGHPEKEEESYAFSFVENPTPTEEWRYFLDDLLVGVGYVDVLPRGMSAIYFIHDPDFRDRGLGIWNVLSLIEKTRARGLPHLYMGYLVEECSSMRYKGRFVPNQLLGTDGSWRDFAK